MKKKHKISKKKDYSKIDHSKVDKVMQLYSKLNSEEQDFLQNKLKTHNDGHNETKDNSLISEYKKNTDNVEEGMVLENTAKYNLLHDQHIQNISKVLKDSLDVIESSFKKGGVGTQTTNTIIKNLLNTMQKQPYNEVRKILFSTIDGIENNEKLISAFDNIGYILNTRHTLINEAVNEYKDLLKGIVDEHNTGIYCCDYRMELVNDIIKNGMFVIGDDSLEVNNTEYSGS